MISKDSIINRNYADIEECLRLGNMSPCVSLANGGMLVYNKDWNEYILCASDENGAQYLCEQLPKKTDYCGCVHGKTAIEYVEKYLGYKCNEYYQYVYEGTAEDIAKFSEGTEKSKDLEIRHPGWEDFNTVKKYYDVVTDEALKKDFENPAFLGGYVDGKLACFIGIHVEGSMGLLRVFPEYRRRGYAEKIYSTLIYNQIKAGAIPYCHVATDNEASIALQNKLGFTKCSQTIAWFYPEENK